MPDLDQSSGDADGLDASTLAGGNAVPEDDLEDGEADASEEDGDEDPWDLDAEPWPDALTPSEEGPAPGVVYAELPLRAIAFLVDVAVAQLIVTVLIQGASWALAFVSSAALSEPGPTNPQFLVFLGCLLIGAICHAILATYATTTYRASPAQLFLGLFTFRRDGGRLGVSVSLLRWILTILPALVLINSGLIQNLVQFGLGVDVTSTADTNIRSLLVLGPLLWGVVLAVTCLRNPRGQGLHDQASHAVVVRRAGTAS